MKLIEIQKKLLESGLKIFSKLEFMRLIDASQVSSQKLLERYTQKGVFVRLKGGVYALKMNFPSGYLIANRLYQPSYISFDTALSYHGIIPETIYSSTSATTKITREFGVAGVAYDYHRIKKEVYTGYKPIKYHDTVILIAEPEKALADYLYFVDIKKREMHYERMDLRKINRKKLIKYIKLFGRPRMLDLMDKIYAESRKSQRIY